MLDFLENELTEEEAAALIGKAAQEVRKRKLAVPAVLMLEMHKPLAYVGAHAAVAFAPFVAPLFGYDNYRDYTRLLSRRDNVERLIRAIETDSEGESIAAMEDRC